MSTIDERLNKMKHASCLRCGFETGVMYKDRHKKVCPKCLTTESILEIMYLVPVRFISPEEVATVESDYKDWIEKDNDHKQEKL